MYNRKSLKIVSFAIHRELFLVTLRLFLTFTWDKSSTSFNVPINKKDVETDYSGSLL
jgi:hypothetical protein